jgi:MerR family copper efflux transcriptional regulator
MITIGDAAVRSGVSAKRIRHYESIGLIAPADRTQAGYRVYEPRQVDELAFIRRARDLGFSIEQIEELLALWRDRERASADVKRLALEHVDRLETRIIELQAMAGALKHLAATCHGDDRPDCPIIKGLAGDPSAPVKAGATKRTR